MAPQYEHLILRSTSESGRWEQLMENESLGAYMVDLGLSGWRAVSSTVNTCSTGHVMIVWLERQRTERTVPTPTAPEGVEVMAGYL